MNLYFAPMEGITTYTYRNTHNEVFGYCDAYFAPFIVPSDNERISRKTLRDILPENNTAIIKSQVLCNSEIAFLEFSKKLKIIGFDEVNLNLGCPASRVVQKKRGSGALKDTYSLDEFLNSIFSNQQINISLKTRAGFYSHDEFMDLIRIYNKYPVSELIIHPRVREEFYNGSSNVATFEYAYNNSHLKLCYNGDINKVEDYENISLKFNNLNSIMIGRGAVKNPAIFREIKGGATLKTKELILFSNLLQERYLEVLGCEEFTLHKLKEIWVYIIENFPEDRKIAKAVKKSNKLCDFNNAINSLPEL